MILATSPRFYYLILLILGSWAALIAQEETEPIRRIYTHLLIDDPSSAIQEAKRQIKKNPQSQALRLAMIRALCQAGDEIEALKQWNLLTAQNREFLKDRNSLEALAWAVLRKGDQSTQLNIKLNSLLGASMTRDARAIPFILEGLRGTNSLLRGLSVNLAASYGDFPLQEELARLLKKEKVWSVRLEIIKAVGQLRMTECKQELLNILGHPQTLFEEKIAAILSIVNMYEDIQQEELLQLIQSNRAGIRELACQIVAHLNLKEKISLLLPLLADPHPGVRLSALNTLALLQINEINGKSLLEIPRLAQLLQDPVPEVAITASWLFFLRHDERGIKSLKHWVLQGEEPYSRLAAGAIAVSGKRGVPLAVSFLKETSDPYIQVTLAVGLIGQREEIELCCKTLEKNLSLGEKWMWDNSLNPLFRFLSPTKVFHIPQIPNYPDVVNQLTRIEILQILCILKYPGAEQAVRKFLQANTWGPVGAAAVTLLQEGDDESLDIVRSLLKDPEEKIRIQSALILALLGGDKQATQVLKTAYSSASKEIKLHILEAIAKTKDPEAVEFLLQRLEEPFQILRVVAATALIQCLYH